MTTGATSAIPPTSETPIADDVGQKTSTLAGQKVKPIDRDQLLATFKKTVEEIEKLLEQILGLNPEVLEPSINEKAINLLKTFQLADPSTIKDKNVQEQMIEALHTISVAYNSFCRTDRRKPLEEVYKELYTHIIEETPQAPPPPTIPAPETSKAEVTSGAKAKDLERLREEKAALGKLNSKNPEELAEIFRFATKMKKECQSVKDETHVKMCNLILSELRRLPPEKRTEFK